MADANKEAKMAAGSTSRLAAWLDPKQIVPFIQAAVLLLLGWWIKDSVSLALSQKQLDLANVTEMRILVRDLLKPGQSLEDYRATAIALAPFGTYAIGTFLQLEQEGSDGQQVASEAGLRQVALERPAVVSEQLRRIIRNRTGFYVWRAHLFAIRTLGQMDVRESLPELEAYRADINVAATDSLRLETWRGVVSEGERPGEPQLQRMTASLDASIEALRHTRRGAP